MNSRRGLLRDLVDGRRWRLALRRGTVDTWDVMGGAVDTLRIFRVTLGMWRTSGSSGGVLLAQARISAHHAHLLRVWTVYENGRPGPLSWAKTLEDFETTYVPLPQDGRAPSKDILHELHVRACKSGNRRCTGIRRVPRNEAIPAAPHHLEVK